jgi:hypothetical protein
LSLIVKDKMPFRDPCGALTIVMKIPHKTTLHIMAKDRPCTHKDQRKSALNRPYRLKQLMVKPVNTPITTEAINKTTQ